ncbi:MAG: ATP-binding protein [Erysipelotrichaceae bacterium]
MLYIFIAREKELDILNKKINSNKFEFGILYGQKRVGKTRLLLEIFKNYNSIYNLCNEMGLEYNLKQLSDVVAKYINESFTFDSFDLLFDYLVKKSKTQKIIVIIDEFTYLMKTNNEIQSILQNIIDHKLLNSNLKLIISGSHVGMIEDALSYQKPLYGRSTFKMKIEPFDYYDASKFYLNASNEDKVRFYSVFGGVPFYTDKIDDSLSVEENVKSLIIEDGAIFEDEVNFFLSQEVRSVATYGKIINAIANGATRLNEISTKSGVNNTGTTSKYLDLLITLGIVEKEYSFGESLNSKKTIYLVKDQLFRFFFRFIEKHKTQKVIMNTDYFYDSIIKEYLDEFVSFEFEKVCRDFLKRKYSMTIEEIGRYWYNDKNLKKDIEIDIMMIENKKLYAFECKWSDKPIGYNIKNNLENKVAHIDNITLGYFSKKGFEEKDELCFDVNDLYNL